MFQKASMLIAGLAVGLSGMVATTHAQDTRKEVRTESNSSSRSMSSMTVIDDGDQYTIHIADGKVQRAEVNGLELAADQVREKDGSYQIVSDAGEVLVMFPKAPAFPAMPEFPAWIGGPDAPAVDWGGIRRIQPPGMVSPPKTMLGISHTDVDEQLRWFLDMEPGTARVVTRVVEGLPAAKAGLEKYDIIVRIDGREPVTADLLTKVLNENEPGEEIEVRIIRKGERKTFNVELEKFVQQSLLPVVRGFEFDPALGDLNERLRDELAQVEEQAQRFIIRREGDAAAPRVLIERQALGEARLQEQVAEYEQKLAEYEQRMQQMVERMDRLLELLEERER